MRKPACLQYAGQTQLNATGAQLTLAVLAPHHYQHHHQSLAPTLGSLPRQAQQETRQDPAVGGLKKLLGAGDAAD